MKPNLNTVLGALYDNIKDKDEQTRKEYKERAKSMETVLATQTAVNKFFNVEEAQKQLFGCIETEEILETLLLDHETKVKIRVLTYSQDPVLLLGPTGSGKTTLARALHGKRTGPFVAVNCTALPAELIESELFGHERGAFTGAILGRVGKLFEANHGTLFLDEIGDMPEVMQAKLLKAIEEKKWAPLGADRTISSNFRVIAATNKGIDSIRNDLYARISTFVIELSLDTDRIKEYVSKHITNVDNFFELNAGIHDYFEQYGYRGLDNAIKNYKMFYE